MTFVGVAEHPHCMKKTFVALCAGLVLGLAASAIGSETAAKDCSPEGGACKKTTDCCGKYFCKKGVCKV